MTTRNPRARFLQNNFLAAAGAAVTASGSLSGYPVANLTDPFRFKKWKPPGTFEVTTANQKIYVNDGANKTATIAAATYTYSTLATAVQTALNAVSSNWTCTYDFNGGTFKFTIGRSSGTKTLRLTQTTNAAWDMLGYVGVVDQTAAAADEQRNHTSEWLHFDLGAPMSPLAFLLYPALDALFPISESATITLKGNSIDDFTSPPISRTVTREDLGICHWLDDLADTEARYWKFQYIDRLNTLGPEGFAFNLAYLGDYVTPLTFNVSTGWSKRIVDPSVVVKSASGVPYFRKVQKYHTFESLEIENVDQVDRQALEAAFYGLGVATPFFLALDPSVAISESACELTKYCRFSQDLEIRQIIDKKHSIGFAVEEVC